MKMADTRIILLVFALSLQVMCFSTAEALASTCQARSFVIGKGRNCDKDSGPGDCCAAGKRYPLFRCSPPVSDKTPAVLTLHIFDTNEDGNGISPCDGRAHLDTERVVMLSSGWLRLDGKNRCGKSKWIVVTANGRSVLAKVVDECDSASGCDEEHDFQPPCRNNIVGGSPAVWKALRLNATVGELKITWSDAVHV